MDWETLTQPSPLKHKHVCARTNTERRKRDKNLDNLCRRSSRLNPSKWERLQIHYSIQVKRQSFQLYRISWYSHHSVQVQNLSPFYNRLNNLFLLSLSLRWSCRPNPSHESFLLTRHTAEWNLTRTHNTMPSVTNNNSKKKYQRQHWMTKWWENEFTTDYQSCLFLNLCSIQIYPYN